MRRSVVGVVLALILAAVGTIALVLYVSRAEERAREGEELVEVYVVKDLIPAGTPSEQIEEALLVEEVPLKVRPENSVDNLANLAGQVTGVELVPGEQLLSSRFVTRTNFANREVGVDVPEDKVEITIALDPERAIGGLITPGTDLLIQKVLVTAVQQAVKAGLGDEEERDPLTESPQDELLITLAVSPADAERIIFSAEFGLLWLGAERSTVPQTEDPIQTRGSVYQDVGVIG